MDKIAVWTQAYNAEKTIKRAMDSILNQRYQNIEYYVFDNGSTDSTGEIIKEYAKKDNRIIHFTSKYNSVITSEYADHHKFFLNMLRNNDYKWVIWCDADDEYLDNSFADMVTLANKENADMVFSGFSIVDSTNNSILSKKFSTNKILVNSQDFVEKFSFYRPYIASFWGKLIPIKALQYMWLDSDKPEGYSFLRIDGKSILKIISQCENIAILPQITYNWWQYPSTLSRIASKYQIDSYCEYWDAMKSFLIRSGPLLKDTHDYLYAIYMSFIEEFLERLYNDNMSNDDKLHHMWHLLFKPQVVSLFSHNSDPKYINLTKRVDLIDDMISHVSIWGENAIESELVNKINFYLEILKQETQKCTLA